MKSVIPIVLLVISATTLNSQNSPKPKKNAKIVKIQAKDDFFLPYPTKFSIPLEVQDVIIKNIQNNKDLEQKYGYVHQEKTRLKGFLKNSLESNLAIIENNLSNLNIEFEQRMRNAQSNTGPLSARNYDEVLARHQFHSNNINKLLKEDVMKMSDQELQFNNLMIQNQRSCESYFASIIQLKRGIDTQLIKASSIKADLEIITAWM